VSAVSVAVSLSGDEGWVLQCLEYWWFVVRKGRGGHLDPETGLPFTTVSASQASDWLRERKGVVLHLKTCQRAFRSLALKGVVRRYQDWHRWGHHSYSYAPGENHSGLGAGSSSKRVEPASSSVSNEEDAPVLPSGRPSPVERTAASRQTVLSSVPSSVSSTPRGTAETTSSVEAEPASRVDEGKTAAGDPCVPLQPPSAPLPLSSPSPLPVAPVSRESALPAVAAAPARRLPSLSAVVSRCLELAGFSAEVPVPGPCPAPSRVVAEGRVTELVKVNGCLHRVADPVSTAFLR